ncbi:molybdopterin dehydrogenase, FAD-binding [Alkaliphilus metalliredigens QYMF]|uniref:Molybdopterin dehydrogenase, FAD-binding n=1 Tax=Alkaliphilus metalliredigens (strain QYMF) TaxID=293826 RepID=A6TKH9_ALKMQ|nr:FAD binding domain-containing protein [Alkaliphilus metalliredigens]ABR46697.1 molybdopterin dehydrogenase, FAD-binding [Alkaliphilus metalliredigens QYMF]
MFQIKNYAIPNTIEEAYQLLNEKRANTLLGGCGFLKMGKKTIPTAIDLSHLGLDKIKEDENAIEIGAMTSFRAVEVSSILNDHFDGILPRAVKEILGVQFRNVVTVGATVYSRYGFSDFITALLALDAYVILYKGGKIPLAAFLAQGCQKDILIKIVILKKNTRAAFHAMRNSQGDYAILNVAVSKENNEFKIAVGARPQRAMIAREASKLLGEGQLSEAMIEEVSILAAKELTFGSNMRGTKEYRQILCKALVKRGIKEVLS